MHPQSKRSWSSDWSLQIFCFTQMEETALSVLLKPEMFLLHGSRLAWNQAALSLSVCLETELNPRCRWADSRIIAENRFISWQAVSHSERSLGVLIKCEVIPLSSCQLSSAMQGARELPPAEHFLLEGHHKLLERSQLQTQSKMSLTVLCLTETPSGVGRGITVRWYFRKKIGL